MRHHLLDSLRIVTTFAIVLACLLHFHPTSLLQKNAITSRTFVLLMLLPAVMSLVLAPIVASATDRRVSHPALTFLWSACEGLALGLGFVGLLVIYEWYSDPSASHLEPLSLLLAAAVGAAAAARKRIRRVQTVLAESVSSGSLESGPHE